MLVLSCADNSKSKLVSAELKTHKIDRSFFDRQEDTAVTWLGMAGAAVNSRGTIVFIDPLLIVVRTDGEERCESGHRFKIGLPIEAKDVPRADAVMYTHADGDHLGELTAKTFASQTECKFIAPRPVRERLERLGIERGRIITARDFETIAVGAVKVSVTPALHDWQKENPWKRGDCCGYIVKTGDGAIWHPGDTRLIDELSEVKDIDVLFFDVAAVNAHLGPAGSAKLAESCGAKVMLAYHYGTYDLPPGTFGSCDPKDSLPYIEGLSASFLQPNPGEILRLPSGIR
jgi:L-ascorbate metabolism protein UlaG (beta-lactamase superfamily)